MLGIDSMNNCDDDCYYEPVKPCASECEKSLCELVTETCKFREEVLSMGCSIASSVSWIQLMLFILVAVALYALYKWLNSGCCKDETPCTTDLLNLLDLEFLFSGGKGHGTGNNCAGNKNSGACAEKSPCCREVSEQAALFKCAMENIANLQQLLEDIQTLCTCNKKNYQNEIVDITTCMTEQIQCLERTMCCMLKKLNALCKKEADFGKIHSILGSIIDNEKCKSPQQTNKPVVQQGGSPCNSVPRAVITQVESVKKADAELEVKSSPNKDREGSPKPRVNIVDEKPSKGTQQLFRNKSKVDSSHSMIATTTTDNETDTSSDETHQITRKKQSPPKQTIKQSPTKQTQDSDTVKPTKTVVERSKTDVGGSSDSEDGKKAGASKPPPPITPPLIIPPPITPPPKADDKPQQTKQDGTTGQTHQVEKPIPPKTPEKKGTENRDSVASHAAERPSTASRPSTAERPSTADTKNNNRDSKSPDNKKKSGFWNKSK